MKANPELPWICFTSLCDWFGNSHHLFNQSDSTVNQSRLNHMQFSAPWEGCLFYGEFSLALCDILLCSHWLFWQHSIEMHSKWIAQSIITQSDHPIGATVRVNFFLTVAPIGWSACDNTNRRVGFLKVRRLFTLLTRNDITVRSAFNSTSSISNLIAWSVLYCTPSAAFN